MIVIESNSYLLLLTNNIKNLYYMKIKDLLSFNPEAELQLLGTNYVPVDLSIYGWGYGSDSDENKDTTKYVTDVLLIPTESKDNYKVEAEV